MRRFFLILLLGLCFGAFAYSGIIPHYAFAAPHILYRQAIATTPEKHAAQSKRTNHQSDKILAQSAALAETRTQNSLKLSWPFSLPDFSFLWTQQHSSKKKDILERGQ
jgi:hypothetical protein